MDDEEVCGRPLSGPSCPHHTLDGSRTGAQAFSSSLPRQRPKGDLPKFVAVLSPVTLIDLVLQAPAQPIDLSNPELDTLERARSEQLHDEIGLSLSASP